MVDSKYPVELDSLYSSIVSLLHMEGAHLDTTATDTGPNPLTPVFSNEAKLTNAFSTFGSTSLYLDGALDHIKMSYDTGAFNFLHDGTGGTFECRFKHDGVLETALIVGNTGGSTTQVGTYFYVTSAGVIRLLLTKGELGNPPIDIQSAAGTIVADTDYAIAFTVGPNKAEIFVDGLSVASGAPAYAYSSSDAPLTTNLGHQVTGDDAKGYYSEVRFTKAVRYDGDYTPATEPFPDSRFAPGLEPTILDPYFSDTVSLVHFEEIDGSTNIIDDIQGAPWSVFGGNEIDHSQAKFGLSSGLFSASGYLSKLASSDWNLLAAPGWTIEVWIRPTAIDTIIAAANGTSTVSWTGANLEWLLYINTSGIFEIQLRNGLAAPLTLSGGAITIGGTWQHIAASSDGTTVRGFLNGVEVSSGADTSVSATAAPSIEIGRLFDAGLHYAGHMDELRITKAARYTADFTVPPEAYPDFEYDPLEDLSTRPVYPLELDPYFNDITSLLHLDGETVYGDLITANSWTATGNTAIDVPPVPLDAANPLDALSLDGNGAYITCSDNANFDITGADFTIEAWVNVTSYNQPYPTIIGQRGSASSQVGFLLFLTAGNVAFNVGNSGGTSSVPCNAGEGLVAGVWNHVAAVRDGDSLKIFVNGALKNTAAFANAGHNSTAPIRVGATDISVSTDSCFNGYISDLRVTKKARYTGNFTPSIERLPDTRFAVGREPTILDAYFSDVEALLHLNESLGDSSSRNRTITIGGAETYETTDQKFGSGALTLNDVDPGIEIANLGTVLLASNVYTAEGFIWIDDVVTDDAPFFRLGGLAANNRFAVRGRAGGNLEAYCKDETQLLSETATGVLSSGVWHHIALTQDGTAIEVFLDGVSVITGTLGALFTDAETSAFFGSAYGAGNQTLIGKMDELRVTNNVIRYTTNFAVPTEEYPNFEYDPLERLDSGDPYFDTVKMLLHLDGTVGSTDIVDVIPANIWVAAGATIDDTEAVFDQSLKALISGEHLTISNPGQFSLLRDWTVEFRIFPTAFSAAVNTMAHFHDTSVLGLHIWANASGLMQVDNGLTAPPASGGIVVPLNAWTAVAAMRRDDTIYCFVNGVLDFSYPAQATPVSLSEGSLLRFAAGTYDFAGYLDEFRASQMARYDVAGYILATEPFEDFGGPAAPAFDPEWGKTTLLLHAEGVEGASVITDNSAAQLGVSIVGTPITTTEMARIGLRAFYLDSPAQITFPEDAVAIAANQDFTLELWVGVKNHIGDYSNIIQFHGLSFLFGDTGFSHRLLFTIGNDGVNTVYPMPLLRADFTNTMRHLAACRVDGIVRVFIDGRQQGMSTGTGNVYTLYDLPFTDAIPLNGDPGTLAKDFDGWFDEVRLSIGEGKYTTDFFPSIHPFADTDIDPDQPGGPYWEDAELINPSWDTNDGTGWTVSGSPRYIVDGAPSTSKLGYIAGGASNSATFAYQDLPVPVGARMIEFTGAWGSNYDNDQDRGEGTIQFYDALDGLLIETVCDGFPSTDNLGWKESTTPNRAFIPETATYARVYAEMYRDEAGTSNNSMCDNYNVRWGFGERTQTPDLMVNGGFETGDFTGWTLESGASKGITTSANYVSEGTYAAYGGDTATGQYYQSIDLSAYSDYDDILLSGVMSSTGEIDYARLGIRGFNGSDVELFDHHVNGPTNNGTMRRTGSFSVPKTADCVRVEVYWVLVRGWGSPLDAGIDDIQLVLLKGADAIEGLPPTITAQPVDTTGDEFSGVNFGIMAEGEEGNAVSYEWFLTPGDTSVGTTATLALTNLQAAQDQTQYYCVVTDDVNGLTTQSDTVTLTVTLAETIVITTQPQPAFLLDGGVNVFAVVATGVPTITYQWYENAVELVGETADTFTKTFAAAEAGNIYTVLLTDGNGQFLLSDEALVTIVQPPVIVTQPISGQAIEFREWTMTVAAVGNSPFTYQWYEDAVPILLAEESVLAMYGDMAFDGSAYYVVVTDTYGYTVQSDSATMDIEPSICPDTGEFIDSDILGPADTSIPFGQGASFTVSVASDNSTPPHTYQWYSVEDGIIDGLVNLTAVTEQLTITPLVADQGKHYYVVIHDADGLCGQSRAALLTLRAPELYLAWSVADTTDVPNIFNSMILSWSVAEGREDGWVCPVRTHRGLTDDDETYWIPFYDKSARCSRGPLINDAYNRYYWTQDGQNAKYAPLANLMLDTTTGGFDLGVPAPLTAPTVVPAEATTDQEEDLIVDRAYVYTYVTIYGEEGPPSPATVESGFDGGAWELTDLADPLTDRDVVITRKRIYRSISSQGDAEFHFVADISVAADLYTDVIGTDTVSTNYTLESEGWAPPPEKLEGLIAHPNGFFVGFVGRDLYFSEPYRPHAWPQDYIVSTMGDIVGLGVYGTTILVATNSHPYVVTGTHPAGMVLTKHDTAEPCVARYGIVSMPFGVYYPGPNGLMLASPRGLENATQQLMTKEEWQNRYQVAEFDAARYQSQYVAFYNKTEGLMFAPDEPFAALVDLSLTGSDQEPDQMQSIFTDEYSGKTFLIEDCAMYEWNPVAGAPLDTDWTSKEFDVPDPVNFGAARIISYAPYTPPTKEEAWAWYIWNTARHAEPLHPMNFACINMVKVIDGLAFDYTVLDANPEVDRDKVIELCETYVQMKQAFHWGPDVWVPIYGEPPVFYPWPYTPYVIFEVIANETVVYSKEVTHTKMFRLPHGYKSTRYRFRLRTNIHIQSVKVAETGKELSRV